MARVRPRRKCGPHRLRAVAVRHMLGTVHVEEHRRRTGGGRRRVDSSSISILARPPGRGLIYAEARLREHRAAVANRLTTRPSARAHTHRSQLRGGARRAPATDGEPYSRSVTARGAGVARAPGEPACSLRRVTGPPSSSASSYETRRLRLAPQSSIKNLQSRNFFLEFVESTEEPRVKTQNAGAFAQSSAFCARSRERRCAGVPRGALAGAARLATQQGTLLLKFQNLFL
jgi:hypothetical protein